MAIQVSRTTLYPGAWTYVWSRDGGLDPGAWELASGMDRYELAQISLGLRSLRGWDGEFHHALRVPTDVPLGTYDLYQDGDDTTIDIIVEAAPDTSIVTTLAPSNDDAADAIEGALDDGGVALAGGTYVLDRTIDVPENVTIRGYGTTLIREWGTGYDTAFFNFTGNGRILLDGLTFAAERRPAGTADDIGRVDLASDLGGDPRTNVTLRRCVFRNVRLGEWTKPGFLAEDCRWEEGGECGQVTGPALFLRCTYSGLPDPSFGNAWTTWVGSGMALLDCDFIATDRGPIFQARRGNIENNLISGLVCDRLAQIENGCEGVGAERDPETEYEVNDNLILHFRYRGEGPAFVLWNLNASGNYLRDFVFDGGVGIELAAEENSETEQTGNYFYEGEVRGGRCIFGPTATGNTMEHVGFIGPRPTRGALFGATWTTPSPPAVQDPPLTGVAVITNFANNPDVDYDPPNGTVQVVRLLDDWTATD